MAKYLKWIIVALVAIFAIVLFYKWYTTPSYYPTYEEGEVSRIIVKEFSTGDELNIVNPEDINKVVAMISGAKLTVSKAGLVTPEDGYQLTLYNENNLEIVDFNPIIIVDNEQIQREPVCYKIDTDAELYNEITKLFVAADKKQK